MAALLLSTSCTRKGEDAASTKGGSAAASVFRAGIVRPASLDPAQARSVDEILVGDQLFDGLTAYDPETLEPVPSLAESWTATPEQQQWDFKLRANARFSDGSAVTSEDVKATFDRIARKDSGSSVADLLDIVSGYQAVAIDATAADLSGVVIVAPDVVRFDLDAPFSVLPSLLSNPAFGIVPKAVVDAGVFPDPPIGSGPFNVSSSTEERISLVRKAGVSGRNKRIDFFLFEDKAKAYSAFRGNIVDWSEVPSDRVEEAGKRFGRKLYRPYLAELFYAFNLRNPKFADIRFREALVRAIDAKAIVENVYRGTVQAMDGIVMEGLGARQEDPCAGRCGYDPERSKALLAEMVAEGAAIPEVQIDFDDDPAQLAVAEAIRDDLGAVGVPASLRPKALAEYQQFAVSGEQELFRLGWIAPYPSPDAVLSPLFMTAFPNNLTGFSSPVVDEHLRAARAEPDAAARIEHFKAAERAVLAELPIIPIAQFEVHSVASPRVRGLHVTALGTFDARDVWLTPER